MQLLGEDNICFSKQYIEVCYQFEEMSLNARLKYFVYKNIREFVEREFKKRGVEEVECQGHRTQYFYLKGEEDRERVGEMCKEINEILEREVGVEVEMYVIRYR